MKFPSNKNYQLPLQRRKNRPEMKAYFLFNTGWVGGVHPDNGLYRKAPLERGTFVMLQVYKRLGISQVEVYKRAVKSVI